VRLPMGFTATRGACTPFTARVAVARFSRPARMCWIPSAAAATVLVEAMAAGRKGDRQRREPAGCDHRARCARPPWEQKVARLVESAAPNRRDGGGTRPQTHAARDPRVARERTIASFPMSPMKARRQRELTRHGKEADRSPRAPTRGSRDACVAGAFRPPSGDLARALHQAFGGPSAPRVVERTRAMITASGLGVAAGRLASSGHRPRPGPCRCAEGIRTSWPGWEKAGHRYPRGEGVHAPRAAVKTHGVSARASPGSGASISANAAALFTIAGRSMRRRKLKSLLATFGP